MNSFEHILERKRFHLSLFSSFLFISLMWLSWILDSVFELSLYKFGIYPRELKGLAGIFFSPFIHGGFNHVFSNSLPVFLLLAITLYLYKDLAWKLLLFITGFGGFFVWLLSSEGIPHVGASGIIYGLSAFLFFSGLLRGDPKQLVVTAVVVFLYGSLIWGVFPYERGISWEGHLFGGLSGMIMAFAWRKKGPLPEYYGAAEDQDEDAALDPEIFEHFIRKKSMDGSPPDPHYHKNTHQEKEGAYDKPDDRKRH